MAAKPEPLTTSDRPASRRQFLAGGLGTIIPNWVLAWHEPEVEMISNADLCQDSHRQDNHVHA